MPEEDAVRAAQTADKLNTLFDGLDPGDSRAHGQGWAQLWDDGRWLPFERGCPNPALEEALVSRRDLIGNCMSPPSTSIPHGPPPGLTQGTSGSRRRALVPGCGRGYDVFLLSSFGWDVVGLEISDTAVRRAEEEGEMILKGQREGMGYEIKDAGIGAGRVTFVNGDFFHWAEGGLFDLIYDYTFLSALPPALRPAWASCMARLLAPSGRLVCVEFPTTKPLDSGGPPWALPEEVYIAHLGRPGQQLPYIHHRVQMAKENPVVPGGLRRLAHWRPVRTHVAGRGTDWVSIWGHITTH